MPVDHVTAARTADLHVIARYCPDIRRRPFLVVLTATGKIIGRYPNFAMARGAMLAKQARKDQSK